MAATEQDFKEFENVLKFYCGDNNMIMNILKMIHLCTLKE